MRCIGIHITGEVQGVFFRDSARAAASEYGVGGFVRNEPDGSVYIEAEGEDAAIEKFVAWCNVGPEQAKPEKVEVKRLPLRDFDGFHIER